MAMVIAGRAYVDGAVRHTRIAIRDGRIAAIGGNLSGDPLLDVGDDLIFPAAIDCHVHFREPGMTHKEDFFTGTRAAALGGVTAVLDMPNTRPPAMTPEALQEKLHRVQSKACVDFGLYGGIGPDSDVEAMAPHCAAFKIYLSGDNDMYVPPESLPGVLARVRHTGKVLALHAELRDCIDRSPSTSLAEYQSRRPGGCEVEAVKTVLQANATVKSPVHFCHVSSAAALRLLPQPGATSGVTPHHLFLSAQHSFDLPAMGKVNPPLRDEPERRALLALVAAGRATLLESDHAPHTREEKQEFAGAPSGLPGVDALLPLTLSAVNRGEMPLSLVHRLLCAAPARRFGLNKGHIEVGRDADLVVLDMKEKPVVSHSKCGWTPYEGMTGVYPRQVFMRGQKIVDEGCFVGAPGQGERVA
ncbi:MAG TPA: hypothetical protein ENN54_03155 [Thermoplasmatales archaeon]|mgnify:CR=1 FL=1|nr:hypothetical protein [Thermoplasmatales archaeon]